MVYVECLTVFDQTCFIVYGGLNTHQRSNKNTYLSDIYPNSPSSFHNGWTPCNGTCFEALSIFLFRQDKAPLALADPERGFRGKLAFFFYWNPFFIGTPFLNCLDPRLISMIGYLMIFADVTARESRAFNFKVHHNKLKKCHISIVILYCT